MILLEKGLKFLKKRRNTGITTEVDAYSTLTLYFTEYKMKGFFINLVILQGKGINSKKKRLDAGITTKVDGNTSKHHRNKK